MANYQLKTDEVVLYRGNVAIVGRRGKTLLILTNQNVIFEISTKKSIFGKPEVEAEVYPLQEVKIYEEKPQVKQKGPKVEIFFLTNEIKLEFPSLIEASKFNMAIVKVITGKSIQDRGADKVKGTLQFVDDALGINAVDTVKGVLENGVVGSLIGGVGGARKKGQPGKQSTKGDWVGEAVNTAGEIAKKKLTSPSSESIEKQMEAVRKLKDLLDEGILSEEEFEQKKKEILGL